MCVFTQLRNKINNKNLQTGKSLAKALRENHKYPGRRNPSGHDCNTIIIQKNSLKTSYVLHERHKDHELVKITTYSW